MPPDSPPGYQEPRRRKRRSRAKRDAQKASEPRSLAAFELLADPVTIAGIAKPHSERPEEAEIERLRVELDERNQELARLRAGLEARTERAPQPIDDLAPGLLDVEAATRLAEQAHLRGRARREALAATRASLVLAPTAQHRTSDEPAEAPAQPPPAQGWTTHALAPSEPALSSRAPGPALEAPLPERDAAGTGVEAMQARQLELEASLTAAQAEITRLQARIDSNERELAARESERRLLRETLSDRERELGEQLQKLTDTREHFEAQAQALEQARSQLAHERRQHTSARELLRTLRQALERSVDACELEPQPEPAPDASASISSSTSATESKAYPSQQAHRSHQQVALAEPSPLDPSPLTEPPRPTIFDVWQDDQIRRHFGPAGIDSLGELLRLPLDRRARLGGRELRIALLGSGAAGRAGALADELLRANAPPFVLHVADPGDPDAQPFDALGLESPARTTLQALPPMPAPEALALQLVSQGVDVILCRDFLSRHRNPEPWVDALARCHAQGCALVFAERTGVTPAPPSSELVEIAERIWERMPERYRRRRGSLELAETWREVLVRCLAGPANHCLDALRARFEFELFARFGYLAEPFVSAEIGANFSPEASRDRRFLRQVADIDERKIEAAAAPALHLIGLVDPLSPAPRDVPA